jgi:hypothetical protein
MHMSNNLFVVVYIGRFVRRHTDRDPMTGSGRHGRNGVVNERMHRLERPQQ